MINQKKFKVPVILFVCILFLCSITTAQLSQITEAAQVTTESLEKRYIISYKDERVLDEIKAYGGKIELTYETVDAVSVLLEEKMAAKLQSHPLIEVIEEDIPVTTSVYFAPEQNKNSEPSQSPIYTSLNTEKNAQNQEVSTNLSEKSTRQTLNSNTQKIDASNSMENQLTNTPQILNMGIQQSVASSQIENRSTNLDQTENSDTQNPAEPNVKDSPKTVNPNVKYSPKNVEANVKDSHQTAEPNQKDSHQTAEPNQKDAHQTVAPNEKDTHQRIAPQPTTQQSEEQKPTTQQQTAPPSTTQQPTETQPTLTQQSLDWGMEKIGAPKAWQQKYTGKGVKVAILDSGIDTKHPDLKYVKGVSFVPNVKTVHDDQGHGTHVAGIIAAKDNDIGTVGVAPDAELYIVKVLNQRGDGFQSSVIKGIEWAMQEDVDIINLSLGGSRYVRALEEIINKAYQQGILIVAAAGNRGNELGNRNTVDYPAKLPNVIAVGATDKSDKRAKFSGTGAEVELSAPGVDIYSTYTNGGYEKASGTSMATPHVTGHLALLKEANPELSHIQLRSLIQSQVVDLGTKGRDSHYGYGRIAIPNELAVPSASQTYSPFIDMVGTEWYASAIQNLFNRKLMIGYLDGTIRATENLTRAEATVLLVRALQLEPVTYENVFRDVDAKFYASKDIQAAYEHNIIGGYADGSFRPQAKITRGEVAALLKRSFKLQDATKGGYFPDVPASYFAYHDINALVENKLTSGFPDGTFKPNNYITRAEFAAFLVRLLEKDNEETP